MSKFECPSPAPAPSPSPALAPTPAQYGKREWDDWVVDQVDSKPFSKNGLCFFIKNSPDSSHLKNIVKKMKNHGQCNACALRASKFALLVGENGSAFLNNIKHPLDGFHTHSCGTMSSIRKDIEHVNKTIIDPKIFIVKNGCFPEIEEGMNIGKIENTCTPHSLGNSSESEVNSEPFKHVTIKPYAYTDSSVVDKYERVVMEYSHIIGPRLDKLCVMEAVDSVKIIANNLDRLDRPEHWRSVIDWVMDVQSLWIRGGAVPYSHMNPIQKMLLNVEAITSPKSRISQETDVVVHKSYKQAANIVDFLTLGDIEAVLREMDIRSDPNNYMISQLSRRMEREKITSKHTISLVWEGKYQDDLDIHVRYRDDCINREIYYGNKIGTMNGQTIRLDFDANVTHGESEPCENVSVCPGTFEVWVNNYTRRTRGGDVPFTIILHEEGKSDIVIEQVWPKDRQPSNQIHVTTHTFNTIESKAPSMSVKESNRAIALNRKWEEYFGTPTSEIPSVEQLEIPVNIWDKPDNQIDLEPAGLGFMAMGHSFMAMAHSTRSKNDSKKYLSQIEADKKPNTLSKLLTYMSTGKHKLEIRPRNFTPSYVTKIVTPKKVLKSPYSLNHYNEKFKIPGKPTSGPGNARFSETWFKNGWCNKEVDSIVQFGEGIWFLVIQDACLPIGDTCWPIGGGFHPTKLTEAVHDLRDRWSFCNTQVMPKVCYEGTPMIGTIPMTDTIDLILDGAPITVERK